MRKVCTTADYIPVKKMGKEKNKAGAIILWYYSVFVEIMLCDT